MRAFVIFRDRVTYARRCLGALTEAGLDPVVVDHGTTWPEALAWLDSLERSGITVLRRGPGHHPQSIWEWEPFLHARGDSERFLVTDPDVVPSDGCPADWPDRLSRLLDEHERVKAGLGLRIDNIPEHYSRRQQVIDWEAQFWEDEEDPGVYRAIIDTTLAMYPAGSGFILDAIRCGPPYVADHLAWHEDLDDLPAENAWYYERAEARISYWAPRGRSAWND